LNAANQSVETERGVYEENTHAKVRMSPIMLRISTLVGLTGALALAAGSPGLADTPPVSGVVAGLAVPTAVQACPTASAIGQDGNSLCAVISSIDGKYGLTVRDARGALDKVTLHQGTIINPTGLQLTPGTPVYIVGRVDGGSFDADRIDAPFEATRVPARDTGSIGAQWIPLGIPTGTFQTKGPNVQGGG